MSGTALDHHGGRFLDDEQRHRVEQAVTAAEQRTSAELKVIVVRHCWDNLRRKARALFRKHGLDKTAERNAVMILVVTANRELLIYGDQGIHQHVGDEFWSAVCDDMIERFRQGKPAEALIEGIRQLGDALATHFPHQVDDVNELSNEVVADG
ncbi:MAG: TPM domain-containing protein [Phycisphaeraceae bacterium]|nr:TPM domain-containing protein [Phycisphaeraceae bacterium]